MIFDIPFSVKLFFLHLKRIIMNREHKNNYVLQNCHFFILFNSFRQSFSSIISKINILQSIEVYIRQTTLSNSYFKFPSSQFCTILDSLDPIITNSWSCGRRFIIGFGNNWNVIWFDLLPFPNFTDRVVKYCIKESCCYVKFLLYWNHGLNPTP